MLWLLRATRYDLVRYGPEFLIWVIATKLFIILINWHTIQSTPYNDSRSPVEWYGDLEVMKLTWAELFPTSCMNNVHHTIGTWGGTRTHSCLSTLDFDTQPQAGPDHEIWTHTPLGTGTWSQRVCLFRHVRINNFYQVESFVHSMMNRISNMI